MTGTYAVLYLIHAVYVSRIISYSVLSQLKDIFPVLAVSAFMAFCVNLLNTVSLAPWMVLLLQLAAGTLIIILIYELIYKNDEYRDIRDELLKKLRSLLCRKKSQS